MRQIPATIAAKVNWQPVFKFAERLRTSFITALGVTAMLTAQAGHAAESDCELRKAVMFYASFDDAVKADVAGGQQTLDTRFNHPTEAGRFVFEKGFDEQVFRIA